MKTENWVTFVENGAITIGGKLGVENVRLYEIFSELQGEKVTGKIALFTGVMIVLC